MKYYLLLTLFFCIGIQFSHAGLLPVDQQKKKKTKQSKQSRSQKIYKLEQTLKKTYSLKKRQKLERRIKKIRTNKQNRSLALTAFILSCVGAGLFLLSGLIVLGNSIVCALGACGAGSFIGSFVALGITIVILIIAILMGAVALQNHRENPEVFGGRKLSKVAMFLGLALLIVLMFILFGVLISAV